MCIHDVRVEINWLLLKVYYIIFSMYHTSYNIKRSSPDDDVSITPLSSRATFKPLTDTHNSSYNVDSKYPRAKDHPRVLATEIPLPIPRISECGGTRRTSEISGYMRALATIFGVPKTYAPNDDRATRMVKIGHPTGANLNGLNE